MKPNIRKGPENSFTRLNSSSSTGCTCKVSKGGRFSKTKQLSIDVPSNLYTHVLVLVADDREGHAFDVLLHLVVHGAHQIAKTIQHAAGRFSEITRVLQGACEVEAWVAHRLPGIAVGRSTVGNENTSLANEGDQLRKWLLQTVT